MECTCQCPHCGNSFVDGDASADELYLDCKLLHDRDNFNKPFLGVVSEYYSSWDDEGIDNLYPCFKEG